MAIGVITGSGTDALPGLEGGPAEKVATAWGEAAVTPGQLAGVEILHVSRHGPGHERLSNHVLFQANVAALKARGARVVVGLTVCPSTRIVSIGPVTSATLREAGVEPTLEATRHDIEGLVATLVADATAPRDGSGTG